MDILKIECEMQVVLDSCISYLKKFKFLKNKLSTDLLADLTVTVDCKKFKLSKLAILNLDENGSVLVTLNHKTNLPKVLVSLKKVLEGFNLWAKDQFTLVCQQPELTYNYKKEVIGLTKTYIEGCKLRIRGIRRVWKKDMEGSTKSKDVVKRNNLKLQKLTESAIDKIITAFNNAEREFSKN